MSSSIPWSADAFEHKYRREDDPWDFSRSRYEQARYACLLSVLDRPRYARALEPGCSVGVLTQRLAEKCGRVVAFDVSSTAVRHARRRCAKQENVTIRVGDVRRFRVRAPVDLIVFSEVGYYFTGSELAEVAHRLTGLLAPGGQLVAAHWTGHSDDHRLSADEVHAGLASNLGLHHRRGQREDGFRWDLWEAPA